MIPIFLRFPDLRDRRIVENRTQLKRLQVRENFPVGILLAANTRAWTEDEILEWLATRKAHRDALGED